MSIPTKEDVAKMKAAFQAKRPEFDQAAQAVGSLVGGLLDLHDIVFEAVEDLQTEVDRLNAIIESKEKEKR